MKHKLIANMHFFHPVKINNNFKYMNETYKIYGALIKKNKVFKLWA